MKKYMQPKAEAYLLETECLMNGSVMTIGMDDEAGTQQLTDKKDMWGKESIWD